MEVAALMAVVPIAAAVGRALPSVLRETILILKNIRVQKELAWSKGQAEEDWACILSLVNTLEQLDGSWPTQMSHNEPLFDQMKKKAESLHKKMAADRTFQWIRTPSIKKKIRSITDMMQVLLMNIKAQEFSQNLPLEMPISSGPADRKARRNQRTKKLRRDIASELARDDLQPLKLTTKDDYARFNRSSVYPKILYYNKYREESESVLPCTLGITQGVRGCIELMLSFLRDYKLEIAGSHNQSKLVGESLLYLFKKLLPQELKNHANLPHSLCHQSADYARQFQWNMEFLRRMPGSAMYKAIQSRKALGLEEKDAHLINLFEPKSFEWESLFKEFEISSKKNLATVTST